MTTQAREYGDTSDPIATLQRVEVFHNGSILWKESLENSLPRSEQNSSKVRAVTAKRVKGRPTCDPGANLMYVPRQVRGGLSVSCKRALMALKAC